MKKLVIILLSFFFASCCHYRNTTILKKIEHQKEKCSSNFNLYKNTKLINISKILDSMNVELSSVDTVFFFEGSFVNNGVIIGRIWCEKIDLRYEIYGDKFLYFMKTNENYSDLNVLNFLLENTYKETFELIEKNDFNTINEISNKSMVLDGGCYIATIIINNKTKINSICFNELSKSFLKLKQ